MFVSPATTTQRQQQHYHALLCTSVGAVVLLLAGTVAFLVATDALPTTLRRRATSAESAERSANGDRFNIELRYVRPVSEDVAAAFEHARDRWERVITGDISSVVTLKGGQRVCGHVMEAPAVIDDLLIFVNVDYIDGVGNVLANAGPCGLDSRGRARAGIMNLDLADWDRLVLSGRAQTVVLHEMGHVFGLGTLWDLRGLIAKDHVLDEGANRRSDSRWAERPAARTSHETPFLSPPLLVPGEDDESMEYLGAEGNAGNADIGADGRAKVETAGGAGTAGSHWAESVYGSELMTGFIDDGTEAPISLLTVRALRDLGYSVDLAGADGFDLKETALIDQSTTITDSIQDLTVTGSLRRRRLSASVDSEATEVQIPFNDKPVYILDLSKDVAHVEISTLDESGWLPTT